MSKESVTNYVTFLHERLMTLVSRFFLSSHTSPHLPSRSQSGFMESRGFLFSSSSTWKHYFAHTMLEQKISDDVTVEAFLQGWWLDLKANWGAIAAVHREIMHVMVVYVIRTKTLRQRGEMGRHKSCIEEAETLTERQHLKFPFFSKMDDREYLCMNGKWIKETKGSYTKWFVGRPLQRLSVSSRKFFLLFVSRMFHSTGEMRSTESRSAPSC